MVLYAEEGVGYPFRAVYGADGEVLFVGGGDFGAPVVG